MRGCAIYIVGGPGVGKSSLMSALMEGWEAGEYSRLTEREMFGHYLNHELLGEGLYLGHLRDEFPGTDALSLSVQPQALLWLEVMPELSWVFGEGERLGNIRFLSELDRKLKLLLVHLHAESEVMKHRREYRFETQGGKLHSDQYCQAKTTQASNVAHQGQEAGLQVLDLSNNCTGVNDLRSAVVEALGK